MSEAVLIATAPVVSAKMPASPAKEFWYFFRQNRGAFFGLLLILGLTLIAVLAPWIVPHDPTEVYSGSLRIVPSFSEGGSSQFLLGTDDIGRDLLSRLIFGARVSLGIGFLVVCISLTTGTALGLLAGYFGGTLDAILMRVADLLMALPSVLLAIVVVSILGPSLQNTIIAVAIVQIPNFTRLVRATVRAEKEKPYVTASRTFGASHLRQMLINILPNCLAPLIVQGTLGFSDGILDAAALGFLGLGAQPPTPEWGTMLSDARPFIESSPWLVWMPGICILLTVLGFNLLGDGLRDAFDPRLRK